uniref:Uncharacterized protein n=1 Tax=Rhipicephalus microplus TaxID=6941 RepID=A0A6G5A0S9_RHIMP
MPLALAGGDSLATATTCCGARATRRRPSSDAHARPLVFFHVPSPHFFTAPFPRALHDANNVHQQLSGIFGAVIWEHVLGFAEGTTIKHRLQTFAVRLVQTGSAHEVLAQAEYHVLTRPQTDRAAELRVVIGASHGRSLQKIDNSLRRTRTDQGNGKTN